MKRITTILFCFVFFLSSCVTSRGRFTKTTDVTLNESYSAIANVEGKALMPKLWVLFIPIGGISDQGLYNRAYKRALNGYELADGITSQRVEYKKVTIPLILFTIINKTITINGVAYQIKKEKNAQQISFQPNTPTQKEPKYTNQPIKLENFTEGDKVFYVNPKTSEVSEAVIKKILSKKKAIIQVDKYMFEVDTNSLRKI
jgi:hypothetical protein